MKKAMLCLLVTVVVSLLVCETTFGAYAIPIQPKVQTNYYFADGYGNIFYVDGSLNLYLYIYDLYGEYYIGESGDYYFVDSLYNLFYITTDGMIYYVDEDDSYYLVADYSKSYAKSYSGVYTNEDLNFGLLPDVLWGDFTDPFSYDMFSNIPLNDPIYNNPLAGLFDNMYPGQYLEQPYQYYGGYGSGTDYVNKYWNDKVDRGAFSPSYSIGD